MTFDVFENVISLICVTLGLTYCVFKYIDAPKRGYACIIGFYLANFLGEYYWAMYVLIAHSDPEVSEFVSYLGWNIAIVFLLLAVITLRRPESKKCFHPLVLLPVVLNIPQFILYISFGGVLNNLWQVGITTVTAVLCMQELGYYLRNKDDRKQVPVFSLLVVFYLATKYGMWTATCFDWSSELSNPYLYCTVISSILCVLLTYGAGCCYEEKVLERTERDTVEQRFRVLIQTILCLAIVGLSAGGFFVAAALSSSRPDSTMGLDYDKYIIWILFTVSLIIVLLVMVPVLKLPSRFRRLLASSKWMEKWGRSRTNFIYTLAVTLILMVGVVIYNNIVIYNSSVVSVYEDGNNEIDTISTDIENYLTVAETTLRVVADSAELMIRKGYSVQDICQYLTEQTNIQSEQFDENFTGIYGYVNGEYVDGAGWIPPEGYDPVTRDWYKTAVEADGDIVIVKPYIDAQTGSVVITIAKSISDNAGEDQPCGVVCLDVIFNHIKEVAEETEIAGKGYGMVINNDGFIIAHNDEKYNGQYITKLYGEGLLDRIVSLKSGSFNEMLDDNECILFISPIMDQWYAAIVVSKTELLENTYSQLATSIMLSLIIFSFISFFYYIGYKNEQISNDKVEMMNLHIVSALASAIDAKDTYTNGHSSRVAEYSRMIAYRAGFSKQDQDEIYMMGLLHDVGKIGVPDEVINKPAKLSDEEFELIKKHPVIGAEILERIKEKPKLATGARWHHERYGGGGYPDGLAGEDIPVEARIIAVADAYDAMTSRRSYRDVIPQDKVRGEIEKSMGTQFDPEYAKIMLQMIDEDTSYLMREIREDNKK